MKAIFLDKDGTLVEDVPYNVNPAQIRFTAGAAQALRLLAEEGYLLFVVTNQPGIARDLFKEQDLGVVADHLRTRFEQLGINLSGFYFCPHDPNGSIAKFAQKCQCRKPSPGLILKAAHHHRIDLANSWMIGDILHDVEAGNRAGCKTILLDNGGESQWRQGDFRTPHGIVSNLIEAAQVILRRTKHHPYLSSSLGSLASRPEWSGSL